MIHVIPDLLSPERLDQTCRALATAHWIDGRATAGVQAQRVKDNQQLDQNDPLVVQLGQWILDALGQNEVFLSAALPLKVLPPRFNRYSGGGSYGAHIDNAVFSVPGSPQRIRSDVSATLFLSDPNTYDGGELIVEDTWGTQQIKLPRGHMVVYPGTSLHRVAPVTRGARVASFFWTQSLVRDDSQRALLFQLDRSIQALRARDDDAPELAALLGVYHNLVRRWADT